MTLLEECDKHEMIGCRTCNPRPEDIPRVYNRPVQDRTMDYEETDTFRASFISMCPECRKKIWPGDKCVMHIYEWGRETVHERCS